MMKLITNLVGISSKLVVNRLKLVAIACLLALLGGINMGGCVFLPIAASVIGAGGTIAAAKVKLEGDKEKAKAIEEFRDTVVESLDDIEKRLEEVKEAGEGE